MPDGDGPLKRAALLFEDAERLQEQGRFEDAEKLIAEAKNLVPSNPQACAEIEVFRAISLLKANKPEKGVQKLAAILIEYADWFKNPDSRDVYEMIQLQRAFSLVHLERSEEALPRRNFALSIRFFQAF
jgi:hypothetical protein